MNARIYADHAATTPLRPEACSALEAHRDAFNPSSLHAEGRRARSALDRARAQVAEILSARPSEIVFTSGGTEGDNLAIAGVARAHRAQRRRLVTAATEHHAVLRACEALRAEGFEVTVLPVDGAGRLDGAVLEAALDDDVALVSLMLGNNEIGTIHPIAEFASRAHRHGALLHTDAVACAEYLTLDVAALGVDLLTLAGHKFGGPAGTGVLYLRRGTAFAPVQHGGGQERGLRAGTENVAGAAALAAALEAAAHEREQAAHRVGRLRERFEAGVRRLGGTVNASGAPRLPHVASVAFPTVETPEALTALDLAGVAASSGSACASGAIEPSHVVAALHPEPWVGRGTLRFSFGWTSAEQDLDRLLALLGDIAAARVETAIVGTHTRDSATSPWEDMP